jgi:transposase InsO family protein
MTSERAAFWSLDTSMRGMVRFGNGSVTAIQGRGTILFKCRNGAHKALAGVYLIPRLTTNIVSLGQLEEGDHKILLLHGRLKI